MSVLFSELPVTTCMPLLYTCYVPGTLLDPSYAWYYSLFLDHSKRKICHLRLPIKTNYVTLGKFLNLSEPQLPNTDTNPCLAEYWALTMPLIKSHHCHEGLLSTERGTDR